MAKRKVPNVTRDAGSIGEFDKPWHQLDKKEMGVEVSRLFDTFRKEQAGRRARYVKNLEMYENRSLGGHTAHSYMGDGAKDWQNPDRLGILRSMVSSAVASIYAPQKPKPQFQTLGATWATRRKAYRLDRICEGIINQRQDDYVNTWAFTLDAAVDCVLQGVAPIKVIADTEEMRITHKLVPHPDIYTDPAEGRNPKNLFQREPIDASLAIKLWPKARQAIVGARPYEWFGRASTQRPRSTKVIELQYAWRLPFGPKKPGRWCAVINSEVVDEGEWTAPAFPFVWLGWERHRDGFWWSGLGDEVGGMAANAAEVDLRLYYRMLVASGKKVFYHSGAVSNPDDLMLNEAVTGVAITDGAPFPQESLTPPFSPMELEFRDSKVRDVWDAAGISQTSAAARREPNITSGIAQLTLNDTKAGRQLTKGQRYENLFVDLAHQYMWRLRELAEKDKNFAVKYPGKNMLRSYKVADSDLPDDEFSVTVAPSSALPHDPAGRQEMVSQLFSAGLVDQEQAKNLIGWPDLEGELNIENAESEYVDMLIDKYLDADEDKWGMGDYQGPEGFLMNKMYALRRFVSAWARARVDQAVLPPDEQAKADFNIDLLVRYIKELVAMLAPPVERSGPGPQVQGPPPPVMPPGAPGPGPMPGAPPVGGPPRPPGPPMMPPGAPPIAA